MHCKKCGKAIGTDRGICPFCGAMLSSDQYALYKEMKKDMNRPELLTEKYGQKPIVYEKRGSDNDKLFIILAILGLLVLVGVVVLFIVLNY